MYWYLFLNNLYFNQHQCAWFGNAIAVTLSYNRFIFSMKKFWFHKPECQLAFSVPRNLTQFFKCRIRNLYEILIFFWTKSGHSNYAQQARWKFDYNFKGYTYIILELKRNSEWSFDLNKTFKVQIFDKNLINFLKSRRWSGNFQFFALPWPGNVT